MGKKILSEDKLEIVGGSFTTEEQSFLEKYLHKDGDPKNDTKEAGEKVKEISEKVSKKYTSLLKDLDEILSDSDENYEKVNFSAGDIRYGDLCRNSTYRVLIPQDDIMKRLLSKEIEENKEKNPVARILGYVSSVYNRLPHLFDEVESEFYELMDKAWGELYDNKIIKLDEVLKGKLPSVCFEQALVLNYLILNDPEIKRLGGKSTIGNGFLLEDKDDFGEHAWVTLTFPKTYPEEKIMSKIYILDASRNLVFEYEPSDSSTALRYVQPSDEKLLEDGYFILRPRA